MTLLTWQPGVLIPGVRDVLSVTELARVRRAYPQLLERETGGVGVFVDPQGQEQLLRRGDVVELGEGGEAVAVKRRRSGL